MSDRVSTCVTVALSTAALMLVGPSAPEARSTVRAAERAVERETFTYLHASEAYCERASRRRFWCDWSLKTTDPRWFESGEATVVYYRGRYAVRLDHSSSDST